MTLTQKIIDKIPKAVEKSPLLQNTLSMIVEMQQQAKSIKKDAGEEVHKILEVLHKSYAEFEAKARKASEKAQKQAQSGLNNLVQKWEEKKEKLPQKFVGQMDSLLSQVGVVKKHGSTKKAPSKKAAAAKTPAPVKKSAPAKKTVSAAPATKAKKLVIKKVTPAKG
jgi:hypothetical protein